MFVFVFVFVFVICVFQSAIVNIEDEMMSTDHTIFFVVGGRHRNLRGPINTPMLSAANFSTRFPTCTWETWHQKHD